MSDVCIRKAGQTRDEINKMATVNLRLRRNMGRLIIEREKNKGNRYGGSNVDPPEETPTLAALGITKQFADRCRKLWYIPEERFA